MRRSANRYPASVHRRHGVFARQAAAGRGIGRAVAIGLAKAGVEVAIADIEVGAADETGAEIRAPGRRSLKVRVDLGDLADIDAMVATVASEMGGIDVVVNNAGVTRHGTLLEITEETWDRIHRINAKGTFFCIQRVARQMIEQGRGGRIIKIDGGLIMN